MVGGFDFALTWYDLQAYSSTIGVGIHAQGGPGGCSTKVGVMGVKSTGVAVDNSASLDPTCTTTTVPEPATMFLMGTGLLGLGVVGYRRRRGLEIETE